LATHLLLQWLGPVEIRHCEGGTKMATKKNSKKAKAGTRGKKLSAAKQMKEVKPLAFDAYMQFKQ
jgi:hypothetical protein